MKDQALSAQVLGQTAKNRQNQIELAVKYGLRSKAHNQKVETKIKTR